MFSSRFPAPGNERFEKYFIREVIPTAANPANSPMIIAKTIIKVYSVSLARSKRVNVLRVRRVYKDLKGSSFNL